MKFFNNNKEKPVILQVLPELDHGGVEVGTVEVATELTKQGYTNFVASKGGRMVYDLDKIKVPHFKLSLKTKNPFVIYKNIARLEKIIKENGVNIVHARSRAPAWSAYWAAKRAGVKYLTTFHGTYGLGPFGIKKIYNKVMTKGRLIISISNHITKHMKKNYAVSDDKIRLVHRCVNVERFDPKLVSQERMIKIINEYRLPEDKPIILLVGRLTRWKGQTLLIEALSKLTHKGYHCLIVGSNQGREYFTQELKDMVEKYNLADAVQIVGQNFDIPAMIMVSDIVLSTAIEPEAFGRASIEGQAMGKIVLASNHGGSLENIIDGKSGKLFENNDPEDLAKAIEWALNLSDKEKDKIGKAAIKNTHDNFTKDIMCKKVIKVYEELIGLDNEE